MGLNFEARDNLPRLANVLLDVDVRPPRGAGTDLARWFVASEQLELKLDIDRLRVTMVSGEQTKHVNYFHVVGYEEATAQKQADTLPAPPEPSVAEQLAEETGDIARTLDGGDIDGSKATVRGRRGRRG